MAKPGDPVAPLKSVETSPTSRSEATSPQGKPAMSDSDAATLARRLAGVDRCTFDDEEEPDADKEGANPGGPVPAGPAPGPTAM